MFGADRPAVGNRIDGEIRIRKFSAAGFAVPETGYVGMIDTPEEVSVVQQDHYVDASWGLRCYVRAVAGRLAVGPENIYCELNSPANAYIALSEGHPAYPDRDLAVIWDEVYGWALAAETSSAEDLIVLAYRGGDVLPTPPRVAEFVAERLATGHPERHRVPELRQCHELYAVLATYGESTPR